MKKTRQQKAKARRRRKKKRRPEEAHEFPHAARLATEKNGINPEARPRLPLFFGLTDEISRMYTELIENRRIVWAVQQMTKRERFAGLGDAIDQLIHKRFGGDDGEQQEEAKGTPPENEAEGQDGGAEGDDTRQAGDRPGPQSSGELGVSSHASNVGGVQ